MLDINVIARLAEKYGVPLEDVLLIALNINGVNFECDYNRMRMAFHLTDSSLFDYAKQRGELDYYFRYDNLAKKQIAFLKEKLKSLMVFGHLGIDQLVSKKLASLSGAMRHQVLLQQLSWLRAGVNPVII